MTDTVTVKQRTQDRHCNPLEHARLITRMAERRADIERRRRQLRELEQEQSADLVTLHATHAAAALALEV